MNQTTTPEQMAAGLAIPLRSARRYLRAHHSRQTFDGGKTYLLSANDMNRAKGALRGQSGVTCIGFKMKRN